MESIGLDVLHPAINAADSSVMISLRFVLLSVLNSIRRAEEQHVPGLANELAGGQLKQVFFSGWRD